MTAPDWVRRILAVAMVGVAMYHLSRLAIFRPARGQARRAHVRFDVELIHFAMGAAMALMVMDSLAPAGLRGLGLVFVAPMLWFVSRTVHGYVVSGWHSVDVSARQIIACGAMAYMLLVVADPSARPTMTGSMAGMSAADAGSSTLSALASPVLRLTVIAVIVGLCAWNVVRLRSPTENVGPALGVGCQLAVNASAIYMLIAM